MNIQPKKLTAANAKKGMTTKSSDSSDDDTSSFEDSTDSDEKVSIRNPVFVTGILETST